MSDNSPVILATATYSEFISGRLLTAGTGLTYTDNGPQSAATIGLAGNLSALVALSTAGILVNTNTTGFYVVRSLSSGTGINITNPSGVAANPQISVVANTTVQKVQVADGGGSVQGTAPQINFIEGSGVSLTFSNIGSGAATGVTISSTAAGTVTSVGLSSSSGVIIGSSPVTTSGTMTVDLPGSGTSAAVVKGDMLIGGASGAYVVVPFSTATTGYVWTADSTGTGKWDIGSAGSVTSVAAASTTGLIIGGSPITSSGTITANLPGTGASSAVVKGDMMVGGASGAYVTTAVGTTGEVWTVVSGTGAWAAPATHGTVTSVGLASSGSTITVTGATPITSSGSWNIDLTDTYPALITTSGAQTCGTTGALTSGTNTIDTTAVKTTSIIMVTINTVTGTATTTNELDVPQASIVGSTSFDIEVTLGAGVTGLTANWFILNPV